jgi:MFS family permease
MEEVALDRNSGTVPSNPTTRTSMTSSFRIAGQRENSSAQEGGLRSSAPNRGSQLSVLPPPKLEDFDLSEVSLGSKGSDHNVQAEGLLGRKKAYIIFFILGLGSLLPWNAFITSSTYYQSRFCGTEFEKIFEAFFSMLYTTAQPVGLLITVFYQENFSIKSLVFYPLVLYALVFFIITLLVGFPDVSANALFGITLLGIGICGFASALMNGGLFALAGLLPSMFTGALITGQGIAGFGISALNLLILIVTPTQRFCSTDDGGGDDDSSCTAGEINYGALVFYLISSITLVICIVLFLIVLKLEYVAYFLGLHYQERIAKSLKKAGKVQKNPLMKSLVVNSEVNSDNVNINDTSLKTLSFNENNSSQADRSSAGQRSLNSQSHQSSMIPDGENGQNSNSNNTNNSNSKPDIVNTLMENISPNHNNPPNHPESPSKLAHLDPELSIRASQMNFNTRQSTLKDSDVSEVWSILKTIRVPAYSVFITFGGTLLVYPSSMVLIQSQSGCSTKYHTLFISILFTLYNFGDFMGRSTAIYLHSVPGIDRYVNEKNIWMYANGRLILSLLLCFCDIQSNRLPVLFPFDAVVIIIMILMGLTNGLFANLAMMYGPTMVESEKSALAGTIMVFCLSSGLLFGACLSFLVLYILIG